MKRPDLIARILLLSLVNVLAYGFVLFGLLRMPSIFIPILKQLAPSPDNVRILEWLCLAFIPMIVPCFIGAGIMGSCRLGNTESRIQAEREVFFESVHGLFISQVISAPIGIAYYRAVGLPIGFWDVLLASFLGGVGGAFSIGIVRILIILLGDRRYIGTILASPILVLLLLPAALRLTHTFWHRIAIWTPYYHATLLLENRISENPIQLLYSLLILSVFITVTRRLANRIISQRF